jgi:hypothetical protein
MGVVANTRMNAKPESVDLFDAASGWLQVIEGSSPILLIAPHGGRAGQAARARLHPRINDLHTAEITRELARRLDAHALINAAMDRNALDCNRVEEIARKAPWMLQQMAELVAQMAERHGRVLILVIHGWNVVQPRIDFGLGARFAGGRLQPVSSAHMTASERFINGPLADLCARLQARGILPTFGLRYPAAGRQNLLQIFTPRFAQSRLQPLTALARLCSGGAIDAVQLELSVALRWPGRLRDTTIDLLTETFSASPPRRPLKRPAIIARAHHNAVRAATRNKTSAVAPIRFGVELFDPQAGIGLMASVDLYGGGARIIVLLPDGRVALATVEGKLELRRHRLTRGPIGFSADGRHISVEFNGPVLVVPNAAAYLRMEHALATGRVDHASIQCTLELKECTGSICFDAQFFAWATRMTGFGTGTGTVRFEGTSRILSAVGRAGISLLGQAERPFVSRASLWGYFDGPLHSRAVEARLEEAAQQDRHATALTLTDNAALECRLERLDAETWIPGRAPGRIEAVLATASGMMRVVAVPRCFMALSRPGAAGTRVYTSMGFARFQMGDASGAGMFECSASSNIPITGLLDSSV